MTTVPEIDLTDPSPAVHRFLRFVTERYDPARQVEDDLYTYEIHMTGGEVELVVLDPVASPLDHDMPCVGELGNERGRIAPGLRDELAERAFVVRLG